MRNECRRRVERQSIAAWSLAILGLIATGCGPSDQEPSFILISLDTTRADHLGAYGYERNVTPSLDELAARGFVFKDAVTVSHNTLISHASLLTGLFANTHGATSYGEDTPIDPRFTTIAEDFTSGGYETAAFTAHGDWLNRRFGFDQGFETFRSEYRSAQSVFAEAGEWLSQRQQDEPFLLFLHLYDPHSDSNVRPYDAPEPFRGRYFTGKSVPKDHWKKSRLRATAYLLAVHKGEIEITEAELEALRDQYDEGLAYTDSQLGSFVASLPQTVRETTWIIVVADHGEEFGEHGKVLHSTSYDEVVRVPLIMVPPSGSDFAREAPVQIAEQVRLIDLRPTLVALAGLPAATDSQGADLRPCLSSADSLEACTGSAALLRSNELRYRGWKLLYDDEGAHLYNLEADSGERFDLARDEATKRQLHMMERTARGLRLDGERLRKAILEGAESQRLGVDEEAAERLKALGYLD